MEGTWGPRRGEEVGFTLNVVNAGEPPENQTSATAPFSIFAWI